jgi:putative membrane-bound dehydrogenase-like protein
MVFGPWRQLVFCAFLATGLESPGATAEPEVSAAQLPRIKPTAPADALKTFQIKKGFRLELVAAEPLVVDPIAMSFDENGRLFVVEMIDYSERRDEVPHPGRIRMLEDTNGDGIFDQSTIFATNLAWPTAVFCANGGIFVGCTPDILFFRDVDGDGKADTREVIFTGFGSDTERLNVQGLLNTFIWGLDNRVHGATSSAGGKIRQLKFPAAPAIDLRGRDFAFDPRSLGLSSEAGGGQHGLSFDSRGRRFACNNSDHIRLFMYDDRYAGRNPFYAMPPAIASIAADGGAAEVYRISPEEPWRVIRTQWRVAGKVPGPIEGGGRASGYFTGATGTTIYRGDAFPEDFRENAFVGDAGGNLVHRKKLYANGTTLVAKRPDDESSTEFLASKDIWFRPVQFANAPDGCLYIADMYREVIEHPWSLPQNIKKYLDLNSGNDRGRIYRIVPDHFQQPKPVRLGSATTAELVKTLEHANGWHRDTAQRLLYERRDPSTAALVEKLWRETKSAAARLHGLHVLDGLGALAEADLLRALDDPDDAVREHAVQLCEHLGKNFSPALKPKLFGLANDSSILVRYQLALTVGTFSSDEQSLTALKLIAQKDSDDPWIRAAVLNSLAEHPGDFFSMISSDRSWLAQKPAQDFLPQLVRIIGAQNEPAEVRKVAALVKDVEEPALAFALTHALGDGLQRAKSSLDKAGIDLQPVFVRADKTAADSKAAEATRIQAIQLLALTSFAQSGQTLVALLNLSEPQLIQLAALNALDHFAGTQIGREVTQRFASFTPRVRSEATNILLKRPERALALLRAIEQGAISPADLSPQQIRFLKNHRDEQARQLAAKVLPATQMTPRQQSIESYNPALTLKGDAAAGKKIYSERCLSCHRLEGQGFALGPDLVTVKNSGKEKLLVNILDPNREVAPNFMAYLVETTDGESYLGLVAGETGTSVTVRQAFGKENVVPRAAIKKIQSQNQSLMPEGLETGLTAQDLANLLEYISTADEAKK